MKRITPDYIVGLVDGEGSFTVYIRNIDDARVVKRRVVVEPKFYLKLIEKDKDILDVINDNPATVWRVEAAPVGALTTFEIELDEISKCWQIRPTSRSA